MKKKYSILALKILFILAAFALVFWKADITKIWGYIKNTNPLYLVLAYIIMAAAQVLSSYRMKFYYDQEGIHLNRKFSIGLYFTSMLYNTILPGGIGGDGYKIYTIGKLAKFPHLRAFKIAVSERSSGLFALLLMTSLFYIYADIPNIIPHQGLIIFSLTILLIPAYFFSTSILLKEKPKTSIGASLYSIPIQLLNALIALVLFTDIGIDTSNMPMVMAYLVVFMASSVASVLPVTIGGAGVRELTFLYGAKLLGLNSEMGITAAFLFFIVNIISSMNGIFFVHKLERLYKGSL